MEISLYDLVKENAEKKGISIRFSLQLLQYISQENPFKTDVLRLLEADQAETFFEMTSFALKNELTAQKIPFMLSMIIIFKGYPAFQKAVIKSFCHSKVYRYHCNPLENNLYADHRGKIITSFRSRQNIKEQIRKKMYRSFQSAPGWMKRFLRMIWKRI
ncbi:hypothetical protein [Flexilinea flocculi]|uniref:Uncharacterized protein n=1 Tax=Flexilinea flocculi TaxID=1678840 RepID=A0A0K8P9Z1_9CHLR|nr:hypothetical protein [Flexilinea flocculi]GAP39483.1 hypothetical protein ATC1_1212 [Flexilinea flocculi]